MVVGRGMLVSCHELAPGVYALTWSTVDRAVSEGDALLVDAGRAAPGWLSIADIAVQRVPVPTGGVPSSAITARVTAVVTPRGIWALGRRGDQRLWITLPRGGPVPASDWLIRLYLWTLGGPSPELSSGVRAASRDLMASAWGSSTAAYSLDASL
jgi:hypothetical protein